MTVTQPPYELDTVVLVGASVRAAAESASRAKLRVIGIDLFGDVDTRRACQQFFKISDTANSAKQDTDAILEACAGLPLLQVGGFSHYPRLLDRLSAVCSPFGPSTLRSEQFRDPLVLQHLVKGCGIQIPRTWRSFDNRQCLDHRGQQRLLVKPKGSSGGVGIRWWSNGNAMPQDGIIQQWVPGRNFGVTFLSDGSTVQLLGICRSLLTRKGRWPFVYAGSIGPVKLSDSIVDRLQQLGQSVVESFPIAGLFNADVIVDRLDNPWLLEINARWSSSMELVERGLSKTLMNNRVSLIGSALKQQLIPGLTVGRDLVGQARNDPLFLKRIVYARRPRHFCLADWSAHLGPDQSLHDIPLEGQSIGRNDPILTLITEVDRANSVPLAAYKKLLRQMR